MNLSIRDRKPITSKDVVKIKGRYLYVGHGENEKRFFVKGIGFPTPPPNQQAFNFNGKSDHQQSGHPNNSDDAGQLDLSGWNAVLVQLAEDTDINAVRIYELDCFYDYSPFIECAAELGIYVILPLTSRSGDGVLSRDALPPMCYPKKLYEYGKTCVKNYWKHPNVLAGVIGNEVMNDLEAWQSAPCLKAYLNDMTSFSQMLGEQGDSSSTTRKSLPLLYATQHDSPSAELQPDEAIKLTLDYLSCKEDDDGDEAIVDSFVFGVNIESWCSSLQSFEYEENGDESSYHSLWRTLSGGKKTQTVMDAVTGVSTTVKVDPVSPLPASVPVVFSEMGCSKDLVNRDNDYQPKFVRDWKQMPLVLEDGEMSDILSGFVAYGYDGGGNVNFRMMGGKENWDGNLPLPSSPEYDNFRSELARAVNHVHDVGGGSTNKKGKHPLVLSLCHDAASTLQEYWGLKLYPLSRMPSYFSRNHGHLQLSSQETGESNSPPLILLSCGLVGLIVLFRTRWLRMRKESDEPSSKGPSLSLHASNYGSFD